MEDNTINVNTDGTGADGAEQVKTYTEEEVMKLLQSESDKRVSAALAKQKKDYEKKLSLSQLDEGERAKAEKDNRIAELEEKLKEFTVLQNKNEITKVLAARGLNPQFADLVEIGEDVEEAQKKIENLDKLFKSAVADEVKRRLAGNAPKNGTGANGEMTKEEFAKLSLAQQSKLYMENPELYRKLTTK